MRDEIQKRMEGWKCRRQKKNRKAEWKSRKSVGTPEDFLWRATEILNSHSMWNAGREGIYLVEISRVVAGVGATIGGKGGNGGGWVIERGRWEDCRKRGAFAGAGV